MRKMVGLLPVLSGIMWGSGGIFVRILTGLGMDGYTVAESRLAVAVCVMAAAICLHDRRLFSIKIKDIWIFALGGFCGILGVMLAYNAAIKEVTLSLAAVLLSMSPIFVLFLAAVPFWGEDNGKETGVHGACLNGVRFGKRGPGGWRRDEMVGSRDRIWSAGGVLLCDVQPCEQRVCKERVSCIYNDLLLHADQRCCFSSCDGLEMHLQGYCRRRREDAAFYACQCTGYVRTALCILHGFAELYGDGESIYTGCGGTGGCDAVRISLLFRETNDPCGDGACADNGCPGGVWHAGKYRRKRLIDLNNKTALLLQNGLFYIIA